jgi:thiopurine S-methyltransferase
MDENFWHDRWQNNQIAFHNVDSHPLLVQHFPSFPLGTNPHVFVPLCGKSQDLVWLAQQGCRVAGVELSELAVEQFFDELGVEPEITAMGSLKRYEGNGILVIQGSIFDLTPELLGAVDLVYDRAALVAWPPEMRERYVKHLLYITGAAPQLLITFEYDQSCLEGPPFSVDEREMRRVYGETFHADLLGRYGVEGGLKGKCTAFETVWQLQSR